MSSVVQRALERARTVARATVWSTPGSSAGRSPGSPIFICYSVSSTYRSGAVAVVLERASAVARAVVWSRGDGEKGRLRQVVWSRASTTGRSKGWDGWLDAYARMRAWCGEPAVRWKSLS